MPRDERDRSRSRSPQTRSRRHIDDRDSRRQREARRDRSHSARRDDYHSRKRQRTISPERDEDKHVQRDRSLKFHRRSKARDGSHSRSQSRSPKPLQRSRGPLPPQNKAFDQEKEHNGSNTPLVEKEKPNYNTTGKLAAAANTIQTAGQSIIMKYHEPAEARKPPAKEPWRIYVFKDDDIVDTIQLAEQSCWLFGRELAVADIPLEHPSCSKQHAVVQFRYVEKRNEFGDKIGKVKPYVLDLESSHGTFVNGERIPEAKYVEVRDKDVVKFGRSRREYIAQLPSG